MQPSPIRRRGPAQGFTLIETTIAVVVLTVGVIAAAALAGTAVTRARQSKFMTLASTLASDKLDDLNRWDSNLPRVCVPGGAGTAGSLTADVLQVTTCPTGTSDTVAYYDDVSITLNTGAGDCPNIGTGCFAETISDLRAGAVVATTTYHSPDGRIVNADGIPGNNRSFHRRWIIEADTPVVGVRRITVQVSENDPNLKLVPFQMSLVRP
jgi:type II secretory pathway pseudopilin PulG